MSSRRKIVDICLNCFGEIGKNRICTRCGRRAEDKRPSLLALPPRTLLDNRFLIAKVLGMGGFGITYLAWDIASQKRVAIKEFFPKGFSSRHPLSCTVTAIDPVQQRSFEHWLRAFEQEASILFSIAHMPGVVKLLDFFKCNNTAYIVMEFLEGVSLRRYADLKGGVLSLKNALQIMRPVMDALIVLHQYGVIHKDISPENIQLVRDQSVKLIDFGAASIYTQRVLKPYIVLKKGYSPVELYLPQMQEGPWSDVYEVGATIYCMITGYIPPESSGRTKNDTLVKPSMLGVRIPIAQETSLMKSLALEPRNRYTNMGDFVQMLYGDFLPFKTIARD